MTISSVINIVSATPAGPYSLHLKFDDATEQTVDFGSFLKHSHHPDVRAYLQPERFAQFHISHGELVWGDYDLCFPVADLHQNRISPTTSAAKAA